MTYQNGWTWLESATEEQMDDPANTAALNRVAAEAGSIYEAIPEPQVSSGDPDDYDERTAEAENARWESEIDRLTSDVFGDLGAYLDDLLTAEQLDEVHDLLAQQVKQSRSAATKAQWGQIEAIEELVAARGARFRRPYEHFNEDERLMERLES